MTNNNFIKNLSSPLERSPFYCRPLCFFIFVFLVGLVVFLLSKLILAGYVAIMVIYCFVNCVKRKASAAFLALTAVFLCVGVLCGCFAEIDHKRASKYDGESVTAVVRIDEVICDEVYISMYYATLQSVNGEKLGGQTLIEFPFKTELLPFDTVEISGMASDARKNVSGSEKMNIISKNRVLLIDASDLLPYNGDARQGLKYRVYLIREAIGERYEAVLGPSAAAYAKALFLGDTDGLSTDLRNDMSALGVSHILAVSGMHTSILAGIIMTLCERLRMRRRVRALLISVAAVAFMFIAGLSPSVVRAVIMLVMSLVPAFFGRRGDSITSLFCAVFLICVVSPEKVMSCSLLLSFASCLAIVMCIPSLDKSTYTELYSARDGRGRFVFRYIRRAISGVGVSVVCSLVASPLVALYFGKTSVVSVPANLVAVPLSTLSMVVMIPLLAFANVPYLGEALAVVFAFLYELLRSFADVFASLENATVSLKYPFFVPIIILLAVMFLFIRLSGIRRRLAFIAPFLICAVIFTSSLQIYTVAVRDRAEAVYMTSKTSEGFLVVSGADTMYVDVGIGGKALPREGVELSDEYYSTVSLDGFMLTHYHSGHISVVKYMLLHYDIGALYLPEPENDNDRSVFEDIKSIAEGCNIVIYKRGEDVEFGNVTLETFEYSLLERSTHPVLMLEINLGDKQILWLGSSVTESELAFEAERSIAESEAVILGHHGPTLKESIRFYSRPPENIPMIATPYTYEWTYGLEITDTLDVDEEGIGCLVFK